ncbi:MAG TPA: hypothetical protein VI685_05105 [Candidatus Angelobacter sp.]
MNWTKDENQCKRLLELVDVTIRTEARWHASHNEGVRNEEENIAQYLREKLWERVTEKASEPLGKGLKPFDQLTFNKAKDLLTKPRLLRRKGVPRRKRSVLRQWAKNVARCYQRERSRTSLIDNPECLKFKRLEGGQPIYEITSTQSQVFAKVNNQPITPMPEPTMIRMRDIMRGISTICARAGLTKREAEVAKEVLIRKAFDHEPKEPLRESEKRAWYRAIEKIRELTEIVVRSCLFLILATLIYCTSVTQRTGAEHQPDRQQPVTTADHQPGIAADHQPTIIAGHQKGRQQTVAASDHQPGIAADHQSTIIAGHQKGRQQTVAASDHQSGIAADHQPTIIAGHQKGRQQTVAASDHQPGIAADHQPTIIAGHQKGCQQAGTDVA